MYRFTEYCSFRCWQKALEDGTASAVTWKNIRREDDTNVHGPDREGSS